MKTKKLLAILLVLTFVLGSFSVGFAAYEEELPSEVVRAQALGVLRGDDHGNLNLDNPITRAEALALVIRISGLEKSAELMSGQTQFPDVGTDPRLQWATGYINLGVGQGIINGYPDGTFQGTKEVTYAEMAKMLLYAMNYGVTVEGAPWPAGVMGKADDLKVFDKVNALPNIPAIRGDVVKMIDNSLTIKHLKQIGYGDLTQYLEGEDSFLSKMDIDELEDVRVTEIARVNDKLDDNEIELTEYNKNGEIKDSDIYTLIADVNPEEIFGLEVDAWVNDDDEVFFVKVKTADKDILLDTVDKDCDDKEITLKDADKTYKWAENAVAYVNFKEVGLDDIREDVYGKVILDRGRVTFANLFEFDNLGVVTKIDKDTIKFVNKSAEKDDIDLDDYDDVYIYNPDFSEADVDDIDVDSAIFFWEGKDDDIYIIVKNDVVEGEVDRVRSDKIRVDGKEYKAGSYAFITLDKGDKYDMWSQEKVEDFIDEEAKIILDLREQVLLVTGDAEAKSGDLYGIVTYAKDGRSVMLTIFNEDGKEVEYEVDKKLTYEDILSKDKVAFNDSDYAVIKFRLNSDGKIEKDDFTIIANDYEAGKDDVYAGQLKKDSDKKFFTLGDSSDKYYITEDTVVMKALDGDNLDPVIISTDKLISNNVVKGDKSKAIVFVGEGRDAAFVVFLHKNFEGTDDDNLYGVVVDGPWKEGKNYYAKVNVFGKGEDDYKVKESDRDNFKNGKVVKFDINNKNEAVFRDSVVDVTIDKYKDGYLNDDIKVDSSAVIYSLKSSGKVDKKISVSRIKDYKTINYVTDDGILVAATVGAKEGNGENGLPEGAVKVENIYDFEGTVYIEIEGKPYPYNGSVEDAAKGDIIIPTFRDIRGEIIITEIEIVEVEGE